MWKKVKRFAGFSHEETESIGVIVSSATSTCCSKCNHVLTETSKVVCNNCFSNAETLLDQSLFANRILKDNMEATVSANKAFRLETRELQAKQSEKISTLCQTLQEFKEVPVSKLYCLISKAYFEPFGIASLYYVADRRNLPSILTKGIMCKNRVEENGIRYASFADEAIQGVRSEIQLGNKRGHDYVPLFFEPKPPMLYRLQKEYQEKTNQNELVYICVRKEILTEQGVLFTDRNLASAHCSYYDSIDYLAALNWAVIRAPSWVGDKEIKHIKGAEVLVPECVNPRWFEKLVVYDEMARTEILSHTKTSLPIEARRDEFYF